MGRPIFSFRAEDLIEHGGRKIDLTPIQNNYQLPQQRRYIQEIENNLERILIGTLPELKTIKDDLFSIYSFGKVTCSNLINGTSSCRNCANCKGNDEKRLFSLAIQEAFDYNADKIIDYFIRLNNRACYICNAQYTLFAYKNYLKSTSLAKRIGRTYKIKKPFYVIQGDTVAKFQFDHYYPKSIYPAFSLSLHNLIPICNSCNLKKSNKEYEFDDLLTGLKYGVEETSIIEYYTKNEPLEITLKDTTKSGIADDFDLKGIYDNHIDIVEEVLERKIKYTSNYKQKLKAKFPQIVISEKLIEERLILGMYAKTDGFDKRPLSKFIHDINDQLDSY